MGQQLGISAETLRGWVNRAEIDDGDKPGITTETTARIAELEREVRELRRANAILKSASAFFARSSTAPTCHPTSTATRPYCGPPGGPQPLMSRRPSTFYRLFDLDRAT